MSISVKKINEETFDVVVKDDSVTTHRVRLSDDYYRKLTGQKATKEQLITKSFEFLLERESNTMIFSEFNLPVIENYFPSYPRDIQKRL